MIKRLWHGLMVKLFCNQGFHGDNLIEIETDDSSEAYCIRCGVAVYVDRDGIYWGMVEMPTQERQL